MPSQTTPNLDRIIIQLTRVDLAADNYVREALIAGQMLLEDRFLLSHGETITGRPRRGGSVDEFFGHRIENIYKRKRPTAYRWMGAASRVAAAVWPYRSVEQIDGNLAPVTEEDVCLISSLLTSPDEEMDEARRSCKAQYFSLIEGKTLKDCLRGILIDGDDPLAFARAHNGQQDGGFDGEDRGDWPIFVARKWRHINTHLAHWSKMNEIQRTEIRQVLRAAVTGGEVNLARQKQENFLYQEPIPREVAEMLREAVNERLRSAK